MKSTHTHTHTQTKPRIWRTLDWLLPIFPPWVIIWRDISKLVTNSRHHNGSLHSILPINSSPKEALIIKFKQHKAKQIIKHKVNNLFFEQWHRALVVFRVTNSEDIGLPIIWKGLSSMLNEETKDMFEDKVVVVLELQSLNMSAFHIKCLWWFNEYGFLANWLSMNIVWAIGICDFFTILALAWPPPLLILSKVTTFLNFETASLVSAIRDLKGSICCSLDCEMRFNTLWLLCTASLLAFSTCSIFSPYNEILKNKRE